MDFNLNLMGDNTPNELNYDDIFDVMIIGGGPAAMAAAIYSMRKGFTTVIIAGEIGGQMNETSGIENYMGFTYIEGSSLTSKFAKQVETFKPTLLEGVLVKHTNFKGKIKELHLDDGNILKGKTVIVSSGCKRKELGLESERKYKGKGVAYCSTCDAPFYKDKDVVVVGAGNSGIEAAIDLIKIAKSVTVVEFTDKIIADNILVDQLNSYSNVTIKLSTALEEVLGNQSVTGVRVKDLKDNKSYEIDIDGVFVEIGWTPNVEFLGNNLALNKFGEIEIDDRCKTSVDGVFAAGDVTSVPYKQIIIASGEGAKAALSAADYLIKNN